MNGLEYLLFHKEPPKGSAKEMNTIAAPGFVICSTEVVHSAVFAHSAS